jgi:hypothetical protein
MSTSRTNFAPGGRLGCKQCPRLGMCTVVACAQAHVHDPELEVFTVEDIDGHGMGVSMAHYHGARKVRAQAHS